MAIPNSLKDRELGKFKEDQNGDVAVNVVDTEAHDKLDAIAAAIGAPPTNIRTQILAAEDRTQAITYADFGTRNERVTQIDYQSPDSYPGVIARKTFIYTLVGNAYRLDDIIWEIL